MNEFDAMLLTICAGALAFAAFDYIFRWHK